MSIFLDGFVDSKNDSRPRDGAVGIFTTKNNPPSEQKFVDLKNFWRLVVVIVAVETWKNSCALCFGAEIACGVRVANCGNRGRLGAVESLLVARL